MFAVLGTYVTCSFVSEVYSDSLRFCVWLHLTVLSVGCTDCFLVMSLLTAVFVGHSKVCLGWVSSADAVSWSSNKFSSQFWWTICRLSCML